MKEDKSTGWGIHCGYYINADFAEQHPELTTRLVLAHCLSLKYMYQHPYSAGCSPKPSGPLTRWACAPCI